ncbi:Ribose transport system permease protein RbsC [Devosia equisanguinis]|uniref:Autoinducer 2 import system permease protein LsrD n=1 Tax=Devosia equisanguinis TaxID=2490941 RepID=A0A447I7R5_9HYPH|nr:ABC transporter permease [Devosia equisanguinis]VDS03494.1 Ribose transport system permease protein RbsC [Devosia equisanguinis]
MASNADAVAATASLDSETTARGRLTGLMQNGGLFAVIILIAIIFQILNPVFLSQGNIIEIFRSGALYFIVACGATLVLVGGGLDFSAGAAFPLGGIVAGGLMLAGLPWPLALLLGVGAGALAGAINALVITRFEVPPLIATLGSFFAIGGAITVYTGGTNLFGFPDAFNVLGQGRLFGIPFLVYYAVIFGIVFHVLLEHTVFGYETRITGGNRLAASANGVRVKLLDLQLYALSGATAALAGIMFMARTSTASPAAGGSALTFQVITAIIIGGTSLFGGTGSIIGTALGTLLFAVLNNGLAVVNVNPLYQNIFIGVILVVAVAFDQVQRKRRFARR